MGNSQCTRLCNDFAENSKPIITEYSENNSVDNQEIQVDLENINVNVEDQQVPNLHEYREIVKKGLLIGINYTGTSNELNGCINDTENLRNFLVNDIYLKEDDITMMNDNLKDEFYPSKQNIMTKLNELVAFAENNSDKDVQLFFSYSGHGYFVKDIDGDEEDFKDEVLVPIDCNKNGYILDDDLKKYFIDKLGSHVKLVCLIDSCHSGSVLDLRYNFQVDASGNYTMYSKKEDTICEVVLISGCKDDQTSADAYLLNEVTGKLEHQGAMTKSFINTYTDHMTYKELVTKMRAWLKDTHFTQIPQLSSGKKIDLDDMYLMHHYRNPLLTSPKKVKFKEIHREVIKKGLIVGINYIGSKYKLNGCINDSENLKEFLLKHEYFKKEDIITMNDELKNDLFPSKQNILNKLNELVKFANEHSDKEVQIYFSFSGHGSFTKDTSNDDKDIQDELLVPADYEKNGFIIDDVLKRDFVDKLPNNAKVVCLIDSCHSGSMLDLRYNYDLISSNTLKNKKPSLEKSSESKCDIVLISGCQDNQTSADAFLEDVSNKKFEYQGAMSRAFINSFNNHISYSDLVKKMRTWLKYTKFTQVPQLSSGKQIDIDDDYLMCHFNK